MGTTPRFPVGPQWDPSGTPVGPQWDPRRPTFGSRPWTRRWAWTTPPTPPREKLRILGGAIKLWPTEIVGDDHIYYHINIYIYIIYIYLFIYTHTYIHTCIYIYIYRGINV